MQTKTIHKVKLVVRVWKTNNNNHKYDNSNDSGFNDKPGFSLFAMYENSKWISFIKLGGK